MLKVLIADDHPGVRRGLKNIILESLKESVVGEADDGQSTLERVLEEPWDVVILDISLPDQEGTEVLRQLKEQCPDLHVLMYSLHTDHFTVRSALATGAAGYLSKEAVTEELVPAIRSVMCGKRFVSHTLIEQYNLEV